MAKALNSKKSTPSFSYLIEKKRDGGEFTDDEIRFIVDSILDEEMPEYPTGCMGNVSFLSGNVSSGNCLFYRGNDAFWRSD